MTQATFFSSTQLSIGYLLHRYSHYTHYNNTTVILAKHRVKVKINIWEKCPQLLVRSLQFVEVWPYSEEEEEERSLYIHTYIHIYLIQVTRIHRKHKSKHKKLTRLRV